MAFTMEEAAAYIPRSMGRSMLAAEWEREAVLLFDLPPPPPRTRWQRFTGTVEHFLGYRVTLRHKDARCDCEDW